MKLSRAFDAFALVGVCLCLLIAYYHQLVLHELPCANCNLQRVGFAIFGGGLLLNLWYGTNPWNHVVSAVGALIGSLDALMQMFIHAPAGTPPIGSPFLGFHLYDWAYVLLTGAIFYVLFSIAFQAAGKWDRTGVEKATRPAGAVLVSLLFVTLVGGNFVSSFLQNGFYPFKGGGQQHYRMLYDGDLMKP
jgi:disulfide bond formation protein DsbB